MWPSNGTSTFGSGRSPHRPQNMTRAGSPRTCTASRTARPTTSWPWWPSCGDGPTISSALAVSSSVRRSPLPERAARARGHRRSRSAAGCSGITSSKPASLQASVNSARRRSWSSVRPRLQARLTTCQPASRSAISVAPAPISSSSGCGDDAEHSPAHPAAERARRARFATRRPEGRRRSGRWPARPWSTTGRCRGRRPSAR